MLYILHSTKACLFVTLFLSSIILVPVQNAQASGKMNISSFVYKDVNRNGVYDMDDRPYAGAKAKLSKRTMGIYTSTKSANANIAGFANFALSLGNSQHPISKPGHYRITVSPGNGWRVTSGNAEQEFEVVELGGSPAGLVVKPPLEPVGVAPNLVIRGKLGPELTGLKLEASTGDGDKKQLVSLSANGDFSFPAAQGVWSIKLPETAKAESLSRDVVVNNTPVQLSEWQASRAYAYLESSTTIGFDDLTTSDTLLKIPNGYASIDWGNWIATHSKFYAGFGYINNTTSGEFIAYNSSGHPASISSAKPFQFIGANLGVAWPQGQKGMIRVRGYRGDQLVYKDTINGKIAGPVFFSADYKDVTRVEFATDQYWQIVMDDVQIR